MDNITGICPHCGNIVEGKKIKNYTTEGTRQDAEADDSISTTFRRVVKGVKIGNAIGGPIGGVVGGTLVLVGSAMYNQKANESIDKDGDMVEDESIATDFEFSCPKCGHTWTRNQSQIPNSHLLEDEDTFNFHIIDLDSDKGFAAVLGRVVYGSICKEDIVQINKSDGQVIKATVVKIFDDGDFCEYVDSKSSRCTLFLEGAKVGQIDCNDIIENERIAK